MESKSRTLTVKAVEELLAVGPHPPCGLVHSAASDWVASKGGGERRLVLNVCDNIENFDRVLAFPDLEWLWADG